MTLEELKEEIQDRGEETYYTMDEIYSIIKGNYQAGEMSCVFRHGTVGWVDEISERQVDQLRADGYIVEWNRACLWYEVSGW